MGRSSFRKPSHFFYNSSKYELLTVLQNSAAALIKSSKKRSDLITESNAMNKKLELQFDAISATANTLSNLQA